MRAIQISSYLHSPSEIQPITVPTPTPKPNEYLIAIHATALNFFDILQIQGKYQNQPPFPWIAGVEFAGVILQAPASTSTKDRKDNDHSKKPELANFKPGDHVFGAHQGAFATHICCPATSLRAAPDNWSFTASSGLMVTAPTSYAALILRAKLQRGETCLIHAAAGGVGLAAVQIAKAIVGDEGKVIATVGAGTGTDTREENRKAEIARRFGADEVVDYTQSGWEARVTNLTPGKRGVDVVFDPVGKVTASLKCTAWDGRIVVVGFAAGKIESVAMNRVLLKNVSLLGVHWGRYAKEEPETVEEVWSGLEKLMREGKFKSTAFEDRHFEGLERIAEALEMLGQRKTWGKVVVQIPQEKGPSKL